MSTSIQSLKSYSSSSSTTSTSPSGDVMHQINSNTEISQFVATSNVEMLWNIIVQNAVFQSAASTEDKRSKLRQHYIVNLKRYVEESIHVNRSISLLELNKSFIAEFIRGFKETPPPTQKLDLTNTAPAGNGMITIEEIKADRLNHFDIQYDKMQSDFDQYRVTNVVSDTKFTDNTVVEPLKNQDMDDMLSHTLQKRTEQENASVPRNANETRRARDWLNLNDSSTTASEVVQPHPEKKSVSFVSEEPLISSSVDVTVPVSPMIVLQTRMSAIETRMDEIHAMLSQLVPSVPNVVVAEENVNKDN